MHKKFGVGMIFLIFFERSFLCSARMDLFDQMYSKTVIFWNDYKF